MASRDHDRGGEHAAALAVLLGARFTRAGCRAVGDSTFVAWYRFLYAPRTGGAYDSHHRTAGIAGRTRRRGRRVAAGGARAAAGDAVKGYSYRSGCGAPMLGPVTVIIQQ